MSCLCIPFPYNNDPDVFDILRSEELAKIIRRALLFMYYEVICPWAVVNVDIVKVVLFAESFSHNCSRISFSLMHVCRT